MIQCSSAVNSKCKAVLVLIIKLDSIKKKKKNKIFKSPKNKTTTQPFVTTKSPYLPSYSLSNLTY